MLTAKEKSEFVRELIDSVKGSLMAKVGDVPESWDGFELRQWIADHFADQVKRMDRTRQIEYKNAVLTRNL